MNNIPLWGIQLIERVRRLERQYRHLQRENDTLRAEMWNLSMARMNLLCMSNSRLRVVDFAIFVKTVAGKGQALPGSNPTEQEEEELEQLQDLPIGAPVPAEYFPRTLLELVDWSHHQINTLSVLLNHTFEINPGDSIAVRSYRVLERITQPLYY
ncbi:hypothetical protein Poli38472_007069 [Pythium oligandrum]|uniref:Uncharacterized protein n=1 Tax=Pythium oligandrum TaxID=41045 RepID=A0A8K1C9G6_PYTOL|nr:hypothetical protein Poli38472_007069 [Pythium oligandrum]|eukprot:TMW58924.1 hypothetical protein Poli38472_007069 [Pythium oligandrum]